MASHLIWLLLFFIFFLLCGVAAWIPFHLKPKRRTSSSSSAATCPPDSAPPSSSFVDHPEIKYDVFLSFRGTDTRFGFLSHLLGELSRRKIEYFVDDEKLKQGDEISSTLLRAIKRSAISLVVFSTDYADSKWCLEELEQVIQCMENQNQKQTVIPIFYKVDPSTVRHQIGSYKDAFVKHGRRLEQSRLQKWKAALNKAANLSGFDSSKYKTEETLVKEIVERLLTILNQTGEQTRDQNDLKDFVGMHEHIQYLETKLDSESQDIFIIGLWGMGGVGKTTIAEILYNRLYYKYEGSCFLHIRDELDEKRSLVQLKKHLLSKLLNEDLHDILLSNIPTYVERRLSRKKVLVILDDITDSNQLKILTGGHKWFGSSSRIVMTSRDKNVFSKECDEIYPVQPLNLKEALQLFKIVLTKDFPIKKQEHCELSKKMVNYTKGVPLAITVLGRYLYNKEKDVWKSKLEKLEKKPHAGIQEVLELSYNGLDDDEHKDIFLYLACFFGTKESKERIIMLLDACGFHTIDGLRVLQEKALVTVIDGFVSMHELIKMMGREIVRKRSPKDPSQRNHLFDANDICKVLTRKMEAPSIESIRLMMREPEKDIQLGHQAFAGMHNLRLLQFDNGFLIYPPKEGFESMPNELRCFIWNGYPLKTFPSRFCAENLVELRLVKNKLQKLWDGVQDLPNLKTIHLPSSFELIEVPDLSKAPKLRILDLWHCSKLRYFGLWPNHNTMDLDSTKYKECKKIIIEESKEDDHLELCGTSMHIKPSHKYYVLSSLIFLSLNFCTSFDELPDNIDLRLPSLQALRLYNTNVKTIPVSIKHLSHLKELQIGHCSELRYIPELPPTVEQILAVRCRSLETIQLTSNSMPLSHKHKLHIELYNCVKLDDYALRAVAWYFKFTIQRMISARIKDGYASLCFSRRKIPKLFDDRYYRVTQDSRSLALVLPLDSEVMGFIFFFTLFEKRIRVPYSDVEIKCHIAYLSDIELRNNVPILKGHVQFTYYPKRLHLWHDCMDCVVFWYEGSLDLKITEELSRIKAVTATTDDLHALVWFELLENKSECLINIKEWAVYSNCAMGFHDIRFLYS